MGITVTSLILGAIAEPTVAQLIQPLISSIPFISETSVLRCRW